MLSMAHGPAAAQGDRFVITVGAAVGGPADTLARRISISLGNSLGRPVVILNRFGNGGLTAAEEFRSASPDSGQLLMVPIHSTTTGAGPAVTSGTLNSLTPIAVSGINPSIYGIFAPAGTSPTTAQRLEQAVVGALNSPEVTQLIASRGGSPAPSAGSAGLRQSLADAGSRTTPSGPAPSQAASPAPTAPAASSPSVATSIVDQIAKDIAAGRPTGDWPSGIEPGNLYLVEYRADGYSSTPLLVSARSREDALTRLNAARNKDSHLRNRNLIFNIHAECRGPNWGALVLYRANSDNALRYGAACGYATPREAILAAAVKCEEKGICRAGPNRSKDFDATVEIMIGHSGARPHGSDPTFGISWPEAMYWTSLGATTRQHTPTNQYAHSAQDAVAQFGKGCGHSFRRLPWGSSSESSYPRDIHSCWVTVNNIDCIMKVPTGPDRLANQQKCVDTRLTAQGYR